MMLFEYIGAIVFMSVIVFVFGILPLWFIGKYNAEERKRQEKTRDERIYREYLRRKYGP